MLCSKTASQELLLVTFLLPFQLRQDQSILEKRKPLTLETSSNPTECGFRGGATWEELTPHSHDRGLRTMA